MACDLAEVIMENWRSSNDCGENDFLAPESLPPTEIDTNQHVMVFREMLLAGATKVKIVKLSFKKIKRCLIFLSAAIWRMLLLFVILANSF